MNQDPALTISLALAAGIAAQAVARHLRVPGIVILLLCGVVLGPEIANLIRPQVLGSALHEIVGLSVAVILFDGGLNLNLLHLRHEAKVIRRLVTVGAVITAIGGTLAAYWILDWSLQVSILFGTLVIVTGPTVITPLLRRVRVTRSVSTILEAEGVLIDPIGAIIAVVALEIVLEDTSGFAAAELLGVPSRLLVGAAVGLLGGLIIGMALRWERLLPEGLENAFTLATVLALFEVSDSIQPESGLLAATIAGMVVGNLRVRVDQELRVFKEQLTVLLIGMLFVLLAADVSFAHIASLGWEGLLVVLALMFIVRPLEVLACTWRTGLTWQEKGFMAWLGPRGIVAAAVASVFGERLVGAGYAIGDELRALVFLVIAVTVVTQGLSGRWVAGRLGVLLPWQQGYVIAGANVLGRMIARKLEEAGDEVILLDTNLEEVAAAVAEGLTARVGDAFDEEILLQADIEGRKGFIAVTPNEGANLLLAQLTRRKYRLELAAIALSSTGGAVSPERARDAGIRVLFGTPIEIGSWISALEQSEPESEWWRLESEGEQVTPVSAAPVREGGASGVLPLLIRKAGGEVTLALDRAAVHKGDQVLFVAAGELPADPAPPSSGALWVQSATEAAKA